VLDFPTGLPMFRTGAADAWKYEDGSLHSDP
jgi:hypothetical protein